MVECVVGGMGYGMAGVVGRGLEATNVFRMNGGGLRKSEERLEGGLLDWCNSDCVKGVVDHSKLWFEAQTPTAEDGAGVHNVCGTA